MSLPAALLQRLAQRGIVQKGKNKTKKNPAESKNAAVESEEVIAEDYDEMETDNSRAAAATAAAARDEYQNPPLYDTADTGRKRVEENFWLERMKERMGEANSHTGHRGCPNKYNIWHKCSLFCVNRWGDGKVEPSREYLRRYKRLRRKYPLPKGWAERYDPGCGSFYFFSVAENLVSWLPPTHPQSQVTRSAAVFRRQLEDAPDGEGTGGGSDGEQHNDVDSEDDAGQESELARHQREIDEIINSSMRPRTPVKAAAASKQDFPNLQESVGGGATSATAASSQRKQKSRDLDRTLAKQRREHDKERSERSGRSRHGRGEPDVTDPMDPSSYSDIPRGKWSDGLVGTAGGADVPKKSKKSSSGTKDKRTEKRRHSED